MELAGLEPAASWVRFGRPLRANSANLQGIERATVRHRPFPITYICRRFTGIKARETALRPKRPSDPKCVSRAIHSSPIRKSARLGK